MVLVIGAHPEGILIGNAVRGGRHDMMSREFALNTKYVPLANDAAFGDLASLTEPDHGPCARHYHISDDIARFDARAMLVLPKEPHPELRRTAMRSDARRRANQRGNRSIRVMGVDPTSPASIRRVTVN
jgi:hypothetical protein